MNNDPWRNAEDRYQRGSRWKGRVIALTAYGCYVELEDGIEGLLRTGAEGIPELHFRVGDEIEVVVTEVDAKGRRVGLGLVLGRSE